MRAPLGPIALATLAGAALGGVDLVGVGRDEPGVRYGRDVRPILSEHCFACHGPDEGAREAHLRLDTRAGATADRGGYAAIVPGDVRNSELIARVSDPDDPDRMPPIGHGDPLAPDEVRVLRSWIEAGADFETHWSFVPPDRPALPEVEDEEWPRNPVDRFVLAHLEAAGRAPSADADRATLLRRVSLDLTGLQPTLAEYDAFLADPAEDAYERVVERLLASPRHAEHMARQWLDLARYADTNGYQYDTERYMWAWREWVIDAYADNMPFDRFTTLQLAGDLVPDAAPGDVLATGFLRNHPITIEGGVIDEEYRTAYVAERVDTTAAVWMGLTLRCARCHDHKFDDLSQRDYYRFADFFNHNAERGMGARTNSDPKLRVVPRSLAQPLAAFEAQVEQHAAAWRSGAGAGAEAQRAWRADLERALEGLWEVLLPEAASSDAGTPLAIQPDGSLLAGGTAPGRETYTIRLRTERSGIRAVRIEALTDPSLPDRGPGRHPAGNFVLSEVALEAAPLVGGGPARAVRFASASADHSQSGFDVAKLIDGERGGGNGWAVDGNARHERRTAVLLLEEPLGIEGGTELTLRLAHTSTYTQHSVGRPRIAIATDELAGLDVALQVALQVALEGPPAADGDAHAVPSAAHAELLTAYWVAHHAPEPVRAAYAAWRAARERRDALLATVPETMVMRELDTKRATHVLERGSYDAPGAVVTAGVPAALGGLPAEGPADRLALAAWLTAPDHPLTARVAVDRHWRRLFGQGLVATPEDYGARGAWPTDPALLDWLAVEFASPQDTRHEAWDVRALLRLLVTSRTYQQAVHAPPRRLDAETIRDNALLVSGLLVERIGGPSVKPYQPPGLWMELNNRKGFSTPFVQDSGEGLYRRSLYTFWKRTVPPPSMQAFDAPSREACRISRSRTNTPLQALVLMNDPQFVEAARHLALRILGERAGSDSERIAHGWRSVTGRAPTLDETELVLGLLRAEREAFAADPPSAARLLAVGDSPRGTELAPSEHAAWTQVARALLNLDEFLTQR